MGEFEGAGAGAVAGGCNEGWGENLDESIEEGAGESGGDEFGVIPVRGRRTCGQACLSHLIQPSPLVNFKLDNLITSQTINVTILLLLQG